MANLPRRPVSIIALAAVTSCSAVAVANGQVSVPSTPSVPDTQPLQSLPQVPSTPSLPSTPSVPNVTVPKTPSLPKAPSVNTPSVQVPSTKQLTGKAPSVNAPSLGGSGSTSGSGGGGSTGSSGATGSAGPAAAGASAGSAPAGSAAARARASRVHLSPRQRAARHEHKLRQAAQELEGCLPSLSSFDRKVIVLRGGLHGRQPLSRAGTARRLHVGAGRVRSAERSGLAGLRKADAEQGCGLKSSAGRRAAARRLASAPAPPLEPLPVAAAGAGGSPALVSTGSLGHASHGKHAELGEQAQSSPAPSKAQGATRRAGIVPTSGDAGGAVSPLVWIAILALLAMAGVALVLLRRRDGALYGAPAPYAPAERPEARDEAAAPVAAPAAEEADEPAAAEQPRGWRPEIWDAALRDSAADAETTQAPTQRRRDRAVQALGGVAATGALASLVIGRLFGRRGRR